jgi:hypothetical protein
MTPFLNPDLTYSLSAIMQVAIIRARREMARNARLPADLAITWQRAMSYGLKAAWQDARGQRMNAEQATLGLSEGAMLSTKERAIRDLEDALAGADFIDNTARCFAAKAAIQSQINQLRA